MDTRFVRGLHWLLAVLLMPGASGLYMNEGELSEHLLSNYKSHATPIRKYGTSMKVFIEKNLRRLDGLDEKSQTLTSTFDIIFVWKDEFLTWDVNETYHITQMPLPAKKIWTPTIILPNSANGESMLDFTRSSVRVYSDGYIVAPTVQRLTTHCPIKLQKFPMDAQTCDIELALNMPVECIVIEDTSSQQYQEKFMTADKGTEDNVHTDDSEWHVTSHFNVSTYMSKSGPTASVKSSIATITLQLIRNPTFYVVYLVIPALLMGFVSVLVFLLPPESGERVGLSITVLLSFTVLLLMASEVTPQGGGNIPYLMIFITVVESLATINLMTTILLLRLHHTPADHPFPQHATWLLGKKQRAIGITYVRQAGDGPQNGGEKKLSISLPKMSEPSSSGSTNPWQEVAKRINTILFYISLVVVLAATFFQILAMCL